MRVGHYDRYGLKWALLWLAWTVAAAILALQSANAGEIHRCVEALPARAVVLDRAWSQHGASTVRIPFTPPSGRDLLFWVSERGVDVELEIQDTAGKVIAQAESPVDRIGARYVYVPSAAPQVGTVVIRAEEPEQLVGTVHLRVMASSLDAASASKGGDLCGAVLEEFAAAQKFYAAGHAITQAQSLEAAGNEAPSAAGTAQTAREAFQSAAQAYLTALGELAAPGHVGDRADAQLALAALYYYGLQDWSAAESWAGLAAKTFASSGDLYQAARSQAFRAAAWMELATRSASTNQLSGTPQPARLKLDQARELLSQLAQFHASRGERYDEALQINNIGVAYIYEARFEPAIPYLVRGQAAFESLGVLYRTALALQNVAICQWGLGRLSAALESFDRSLAIMRPAPYPDLYLLTLNNSGLAHYAAGQFDTALRLQTQALDFAALTQSDRARARSYYGMGVTYYAIGDLSLASHFLHSSLEIGTAELDARNRVATLRALAVIEHEQGDLATALTHNSEALRLATAPSARARILLQLAQNHADLGQSAQALEIVNNLVAAPPSGDELVRALALAERGRLRHAQGSLGLARADLAHAMGVFEALDSVAERFETQVELARVEAALGHQLLALTTVRQALRLAPELRAQTANPEYRASIVQSVRPALEFEVGLLRQRYDLAVALNDRRAMRRWALESLRAADESRAVEFESWRGQHLDGADDRKVAQLLNSTTSLYREMAERRFQLATREDRAGVDDPRAQKLRADIARLRVQVGLVSAELAAHTGGGASSVIGVSGSTGGAGHSAELRPWTGRLPRDHVFVEYWLDERQAYAWTVAGDEVEWISLGSAEEISRKARDLHEQLRASMPADSSQHLKYCNELYRRLITPLGEKVGSAPYLTIVPDGALNYIPFAALRSPDRSERPYLVQQTVISIAPALRLLAASTHRAAVSVVKSMESGAADHGVSGLKSTGVGDRMLLVADAVYTADDPRLQTSAALLKTTSDSKAPGSRPEEGLIFRSASGAGEFVRLPATGREAERIRAEYGDGRVDLLGGLDATREALLAKDFSSYRFIHIAVHGVIDAEIPQLSALVLGNYGRSGPVGDPAVRAGDLLAKTFNAEAVVLSACDSALGKEYVGEGLIGLRYAALARGAHTVIASLWPVSDGIAADLMTEMYRQIAANDSRNHPVWTGTASENVALSLTTAIRQVLEQTPALDPALWAPFSVYVAGD